MSEMSWQLRHPEYLAFLSFWAFLVSRDAHAPARKFHTLAQAHQSVTT